MPERRTGGSNVHRRQATDLAVANAAGATGHQPPPIAATCRCLDGCLSVLLRALRRIVVRLPAKAADRCSCRVGQARCTRVIATAVRTDIPDGDGGPALLLQLLQSPSAVGGAVGFLSALAVRAADVPVGVLASESRGDTADGALGRERVDVLGATLRVRLFLPFRRVLELRHLVRVLICFGVGRPSLWRDRGSARRVNGYACASP